MRRCGCCLIKVCLNYHHLLVSDAIAPGTIRSGGYCRVFPIIARTASWAFKMNFCINGLAGIAPTIIIMLILRVGQLMSVGHEKILLLYNESIYETSDVISTYIYRKGLIEQNYSFSSAVGLFNSVINFTLVMSVNALSRKVSETSLW